MTPEVLKQALDASGLPDGLGWAVASASDIPGALFEQERAAMRRAVPSRIAEFTGGRVAARAAMAQLGLPPRAIPMQGDRAPHWPSGVVGSISHGGGLCVAVVARAGLWRGIGVDIEPDVDMHPDLIPEIASPSELETLSLPPERAALRIFSAKESAFKAQYPITGATFGFDALRADLPNSRMVMHHDIGLGQGAEIPVWQQRIDGLVVSLSLLSCLFDTW
ncbi:4'-phosphopantetheinyl transferase superfamily protein [Citreicella sp. C3M06]|nr:4'-phosphopantetheinyl transferase superfamily protein [Citreicella sp. C3M06]